MKCLPPIFLVLVAAALTPAAKAQTLSAQERRKLMEMGYIGDDEGVVLMDGGAAPPGATGPDGAPAAKAGPTPRQQQLMQQNYDRRASKILELWSTPPKEEDAAEGEAAEDTEESAGEDAEGEGAGEAEGAAKEGEEAGEGAGEEASEDAAAEGEGAGAEDAQAGEAGEAAEERTEAERAAAEATAAAEAQARAATEAAAAAAKAKAEEAKQIAAEMSALQRDVTLGHWEKVGEYLAGLTEAESQAGYTRLLQSLVQGPPPPNTPFRNWAEKNQFSADDVFGLAAAAPAKLEDAQLDQLGQILQMAVAQGHLLEECVARLREGLKSEDFPLRRRQVALLVFGAGHPVEAEDFLPTLEGAIERDDREGLNLLGRHLAAKYEVERDIALLEAAWEATQAALADGKVRDDIKAEALARCVEMAPKLSDELGEAWLVQSFTQRPQRGMEVLATIGSVASTGMQDRARGSDVRGKALALQTTAARALLEAAPERAREWRGSLVLLANNWLREAEYSETYDTSTSRRPIMQRDVYGNYFYNNYYNNMNRGNQPQAIPTGEILKLRPSEAWVEVLDTAQQPKFAMVTASLLLKVGEEEEAFPYIERLARSHPDRAKDLVDEFLQVWIDNHDPNSSRNRTDMYMFSYGYNQRASGIPLTRSKQERNLADLAGWVERLRALPLKLDQKAIARAFVSSHSSAEVYRIEALEKVFGSLDEIGPEALAEFVQTMRRNLAEVWRLPSTQEDQKTRRRQKDVEAEVRRGYGVCRSLCDQGLSEHGEHWALQLAMASVAHDENDFLQELSKSPEYAERRSAALTMFEAAAEAYARALPDLDEDERSAQVHETWFYAALGASDLGGVDHTKQLIGAEIPKIRAAMDGLPGEAADQHLGKFANSLFTRMSAVNPAVKFRYVEQGLSIVGEDERADEARKVFDYYRDLVTEIQLVTRIDGSDRVGHDRPFGLFIDLRHTKEIERESGGFSKYLTNQNNQQYAYNYGRPLEDYRDKFEEAARAQLAEHFEVKSITFNDPDVSSKADPEYGWRVTPYAYALLQARGPEIDRVPTLKLDLDFLDTSGYAVVPVQSAPLAMDAAAPPEPRPFEGLAISQTLDERDAASGKLKLEVKARASGLVPELDALLDLAPEGFEIAAVEDQGVSVDRFDPDSDQTRMRSERLWMVELQGREDLAALPETFAFGAPRVPTKESEYLRYDDADLRSVDRVVSLEQDYGEVATPTRWPWFVGGGLLLALLVFAFTRRRAGEETDDDRLRAPEEITPFTVIGFLREVDRRNHLKPKDRDALVGQIQAIERYYFLDDRSSEPDLGDITRHWARRVG